MVEISLPAAFRPVLFIIFQLRTSVSLRATARQNVDGVFILWKRSFVMDERASGISDPFFFSPPVFTRTNNLSFFLFFISIFLAIYNTLYRDLSFHWVHIKEAIMRGRG